MRCNIQHVKTEIGYVQSYTHIYCKIIHGFQIFRGVQMSFYKGEYVVAVEIAENWYMY